MTTKQANEMLDEVERQLSEEFRRRFHLWLDTTRDDARKVTAIQVRDRGNGDSAPPTDQVVKPEDFAADRNL
jgi:MoxR-like ATPase